jgi:NitT/TauT family transport system substrate-binding protein
MREYGIVAGGDAAKSGLFTMTDARWETTVAFLRATGLAKPNTDYRKGWTLEIVNSVKVTP